MLPLLPSCRVAVASRQRADCAERLGDCTRIRWRWLWRLGIDRQRSSCWTRIRRGMPLHCRQRRSTDWHQCWRAPSGTTAAPRTVARALANAAFCIECLRGFLPLSWHQRQGYLWRGILQVRDAEIWTAAVADCACQTPNADAPHAYVAASCASHSTGAPQRNRNPVTLRARRGDTAGGKTSR